MKPLFNEFLAENEDGRQVSETVYPLLKALYQTAKDKDFSFRDISNIIANLNGVVQAEFVLSRASGMSKQRRLCRTKI